MPGGNRSHRGASVRCSTHPYRRPGRHDRCHDPPAPGDRSLRARRLPLVERLGPGPRAGRRAQADRHQRGLRPRHHGGGPGFTCSGNSQCFGQPSNGVEYVNYTDPDTWVGPDSDATLDANDEVALMVKDTGVGRVGLSEPPGSSARESRSRPLTHSTPARATSTSSVTTAASTRARVRNTWTTTST